MPEITIDLTNFLKLPWYGQIFIVLLFVWAVVTAALFIYWILHELFHWTI